MRTYSYFKNDGILLLVFIIGILFGPYYLIGNFLFVDIWILLFLFLRIRFSYKLYKKFLFNVSIRKPSLLLLLLLLSVFVSQIVNSAAGNLNIVFSDLSFYLRYLRALLILTISSTFYWDNENTNILTKYLPIVVVLYFSFCLYIHLNRDFLSTIISSFYTIEEERITAINYRIVGTFGNPNQFSVAVSILGSFCLVASMHKSLLIKIFYILIYLYSLFVIAFYSLSRTGMITSLLVGFIVLFIEVAVNKKLIYYVFLLIILVFIFDFFLKNAQDYEINPRISGIFDQKSRQDAFDGRIDVYWDQQLKEAIEKPIFGNGASSSVIQISDNGYLHKFWREGFLGLILYLIFYFYSLIKGVAFYKSSNETHRRLLALSTLLILFIMILSEFTAEFLMSSRLSPLFFVFLGIMYGNGQQIKSCKTI